MLTDTVCLCNRNSSWLVFLSREVDRMRGLWSAACSPVNHAHGRGTPLGERAFIFPWQGILYVCGARWLTQSWTPKFLDTKCEVDIKKDTTVSVIQGLLYRTDERFLRPQKYEMWQKLSRFEVTVFQYTCCLLWDMLISGTVLYIFALHVSACAVCVCILYSSSYMYIYSRFIRRHAHDDAFHMWRTNLIEKLKGLEVEIFRTCTTSSLFWVVLSHANLIYLYLSVSMHCFKEEL